jgi:hypothetical protein
VRLFGRIIIVLLPLAMAALGALAGPTLARRNYTVALADEVEAQRRSPSAPITDRLRAYSATGEPRPALLARAQAVESNFRVGGTVFGAWLGLVAALKIAALRRVPRRTEYEIDQGKCMACGRCFRYCPRERLRLKQRAAGPAEPIRTASK